MKIVVMAFSHSVGDVRVYDKEAVTLRDAGHEVTVLARENSGEGHKHFFRKSRYEVHGGIKRILFPRPVRSFLVRKLFDVYWLIRYFCTAIRLKADVYHCHEPQSLFVGLFLGKLKHAKVVYDCHEYQPESSAAFAPKWIQPAVVRLFRRMEASSSAKVDAVVTVNEELATRFRANCSRVVVLQNYPLSGTFEVLPARDAVSSEVRKLADEDRILIYHGSLSEERGLLHCIDLLRRLRKTLPNVQLWIIGSPGAPGFMEKLHSRIADVDGNNIRLFPWMPHGRLLEYLCVADLGLFLPGLDHDRYRRAEPVKFFEYAASEVAVAMSDVPALRSLVEIADNGILLDPGRPEEMAVAVAKFIDDTDRLAEAKRHGRLAFLRRFRWQAVSGRLVRLYEQLSDEKRLSMSSIFLLMSCFFALVVFQAYSFRMLRLLQVGEV